MDRSASKMVSVDPSRRDSMKKKFLQLAERAETEGDKEKAEKMRLAASRC